MDFTPEQIAADDAAYKALEQELSQEDPEAGPFGAPLDAPGETEPRQQAHVDGPDNDQVMADDQLEQETQAYLQAQLQAWQQQAWQQQQQQRMEDDPIGYFQSELARRDEQAQQQQFWGYVQHSENAARQQWKDYDEATGALEQLRIDQLEGMYPDTAAVNAQAKLRGFQSAKHMRETILNQDRIQVAQQALAMGISPAEHNLANRLVPGRRGRTAGTRSRSSGSRGSSPRGGQSRDAMRMSELADLALEDGDEFDRAWAVWEKNQR